MIEKSIHNQTQNYLQRNGLVCVYQSSLRVNHSTDTCLSRLTDMILNGAENEKHKHPGNSYHTNRAFFVSLDNQFSEAGTINCGVPQGCTLRLLLFLLYVNDIPQALSDSHKYLYADDTSIFY